MRELAIDIETFSSEDLTECGVYRYAESSDFEVLLFAYAIDGGPVTCVDLAQGETLPDEVRDALTDPGVTKTAYNAAFERVCLSRWLGIPLMDPRQWQCTMVAAARMGLPLSLGQCAEVLGLPQGKMEEGRLLIRTFSKPVKRRGETFRVFPGDDLDKWELFKAYNIRDVEVEQAVLKAVRRLQPAEFDRELYVVDQLINDRGVLIDRLLVDNAARMDEEYKAQLQEEARQISGLENPNSPSQIKQWLHDNFGIAVDTLNKSSLPDLEARLKYQPKAQRLLAIRRELGKASTAKYVAMQKCVCADGRIHGLLQFYGAPRTGRWAGRLVQVQNLPQNHIPDLDYARDVVKRGDLEDFEINYDNPTHVLSELIRTAFVAKPGHVLHVCDFSAIEARVIAWLAGEDWVLDVFRDGGDIYCATASQMFGVPVAKHGPNAGLRQKGKIAVLALGYGGGVAALEAMGGSRMGLTESEEREIIRKWREANPRIVKLWKVLEKAAAMALKTGGSYHFDNGVEVSRQWGCLLITLPSGRTICYPRARLDMEEEEGVRSTHQSIVYEGINQTTRKWETVRTYGGKLVENLVQSVARDILGEVLLRAHRAGMEIVFHVHDEIVVEAGPRLSLEAVEELFGTPIEWCKGLPLKGAGYTTKYYKKD